MKKEPMNRTELARNIYKHAYLTGEFKLRSGQISHEYFDKYQFESLPWLLEAITSHLKELIFQKNLENGGMILAGLETGGIPLAVMLSNALEIPCVFVRKRAKDYGTCKIAEGVDVKGKEILVVEDVVTTGGQIGLSVKDLREMGALVNNVICVIDREQGGPVNLEKQDLLLHPLFTMSEIKRLAS